MYYLISAERTNPKAKRRGRTCVGKGGELGPSCVAGKNVNGADAVGGRAEVPYTMKCGGAL